jgi:hypothetical protein
VTFDRNPGESGTYTLASSVSAPALTTKSSSVVVRESGIPLINEFSLLDLYCSIWELLLNAECGIFIFP